MKLIYLLTLILLASCKVFKPNAPSAATTTPEMLQPIKSEIDIPVTVNLSDYYQQADAAAPRDLSGGADPCQGLRYAYGFNRSPFTITGSGNEIRTAFEGRYWINATYCALCKDIFGLRCVVPKVSASCGTGGDLRKVNIGYSSAVSVAPDFRLISSTSLTTLQPLNRCTGTILNIDVTDRLLGFVRGPLEEIGRTVDQKVTNVNLRGKVEEFWTKLSEEMSMGEIGFLSINPDSLRISNFNINNATLNFSIGMSAYPVLRSQSQAPEAKPLPDLSNYTPGNGFFLTLDVFETYTKLNQLLNQQVKGQVVKVGARNFRIDNVMLYGTANQKIAIEIKFSGSRKGKLYLTGTPNYNSITQQLTFPNLNFDTDSRNKLAKWLLNAKITSYLRSQAQFNFSNLLNSTQAQLQAQLNRTLGDNVLLAGQISNFNIDDVYPAATNLVLRVRATGTVMLQVNQSTAAVTH